MNEKRRNAGFVCERSYCCSRSRPFAVVCIDVFHSSATIEVCMAGARDIRTTGKDQKKP